MDRNYPEGADLYQQIIHVTRYAKYRPDLQRREFWNETVDRYADFMESMVHERTPYRMTNLEVSNLREAIWNFRVMPSMRAVMTAGPAAAKDNMAIYNCSYAPIKDHRVFSELLYILMCGTGVGFSVERQYVNQLPAIPDVLAFEPGEWVVEDSKVGWAESLQYLLDMLYAGKIPKFDYSMVRPKGAILKTFGGRASGPDPLKDLHRFIITIFTHATGRKLNSLECHDIACKIGEVVVSGGVRRSALISLSNLSDDRMRDAKKGNFGQHAPYRYMANNSSALTEIPEMGRFMSEWHALYESKSGERGFFNRVAAKHRIAGLGTRDPNYDFGTNPCVTGDTLILTKTGYFPIKDLVGKSIEIWNGYEWSEVVPFSTGRNEIVRIHLSNGVYLDTTLYHKFVVDSKHNYSAERLRPKYPGSKRFTYGIRVEAQKLRVGDKLSKFDFPVVDGLETYEIDAYSQGFYSGDGVTDGKRSKIYEPKFEVIPRIVGEVLPKVGDGSRYWKHGKMLDKRFVPINGSISFKLNWLAGYLDADGTVTNDVIGQGIQAASVSSEFLNDIRLMLTTLGIDSKVVKGGEGGWGFIGDEDGSRSLFKPWKRIVINSVQCHKLQLLGLRTNRLKFSGLRPEKSKSRFVKVEKIELLEKSEETFCFTDPKRNLGTFNGVVTANCGEILLRPFGLCNLSEIVVRPHYTLEDMRALAHQATMLGTIQSLLTNFRYVRDDWRRNAEEERLLGVSLTGLADHPILGIRSPQTVQWLTTMRLQTRETNNKYADLFGINRSAAITTIKPSGTVSQLVDSASGVHRQFAPRYIRRIRGDMNDPTTKLLIDAGVPWEPDSAFGNNAVFSFVKRAPNQDRRTFRENESAVEFMEYVKMFGDYWTDHNPSVTVNVKDHEWLEVGAWVYKNLESVCGMSFLPYDGGSYVQAPYEETDEASLIKIEAAMPKSIDWSRLPSFGDGDEFVTATKELACVAGVCEVTSFGSSAA